MNKFQLFLLSAILVIISAACNSDQDLYIRATTHEDLLTQANAAEQIKDQELLMKLANNSPNSEVRIQAAARIHDEKLLIKLATTDKSWYVSFVAVSNKHLKDQKTLGFLVLNHPHGYVRMEAAKKVTNEDILIKVLMTDKYEAARCNAAENPNLKSQDALATILKNEPSYQIRFRLVKKMTDQNYLENIALKDKEWLVRVYALERIKCPKILKQFALNGIHEVERRVAVANKNFTDIKTIEWISKNDPSKQVRREAKWRL